eukprot:CAMPEP_0196801300 /NCGR_PEP_ID=MMETSP1362-20130617/1066_1 /TAXON_ID=163516 /ORGANISM="Leptocylindrus danicus, Strain CCMP1856" /LENGTH=124 /DNA_ID=CAMNT_0042172195 /DNA_START=76 /DNA_END=447 /DNA_ORIENTATION=-
MKLSLLAVLTTIVAAKDGAIVRNVHDNNNKADGLRLRGSSIRREVDALMTEIAKNTDNELNAPTRALKGKGGKGSGSHSYSGKGSSSSGSGCSDDDDDCYSGSNGKGSSGKGGSSGSSGKGGSS